MTTELQLPWKGTDIAPLPRRANVEQLVEHGLQLSPRDKKQIVEAFRAEHYEMLATYVWNKSITTLRHQLSKMGKTFIAELLDRTDIDEDSDLQQSISEYEAIRLAEELGVIGGTGAFRLRQAMDTVAHFNQIDMEGQSDDEMSEDETKMIVRSCVQGVLGYNRIDAAIDFKHFRDQLGSMQLKADDPSIMKLIQSPYFFYRTTIRILLSLIKSSSGAPLESVLANSNTIIPQLWDNLKHPERYQIGRCYGELHTDGKTTATKGMRSILLKVNGFDFVPEDLRSQSFIKAAEDVLTAHYSFNNFYNEPAPMRQLESMGTTFPPPAFAKCMTAVLVVKLGNTYGRSIGAQKYADLILERITPDRWVNYFMHCLETDDRVLSKLTQTAPVQRFLNYFDEDFFSDIITRVSSEPVVKLLEYFIAKDQNKIKRQASKMYNTLGYKNS